MTGLIEAGQGLGRAWAGPRYADVLFHLSVELQGVIFIFDKQKMAHTPLHERWSLSQRIQNYV